MNILDRQCGSSLVRISYVQHSSACSISGMLTLTPPSYTGCTIPSLTNQRFHAAIAKARKDTKKQPQKKASKLNPTNGSKRTRSSIRPHCIRFPEDVVRQQKSANTFVPRQEHPFQVRHQQQQQQQQQRHHL
jgi:hypothetical protein